MEISKVALIINPISGQDFPILSVANRFFSEHHIAWQPYVTLKKNDATRFTKQALKDNVDLVIVYGGDGTVMEASKVLATTSTPLLILAGGTANVVAKEMRLPGTILETLQLLLPGKHSLTPIDTYKIQNVHYMLRLNVGFFANIVRQAPRSSKDSLGRFAYLVSGVQALQNANNRHYDLLLDDTERIEAKCIGMTITNVGNVGVQDMSFHPEIDPRDGKLDILILPEANIASLAALATEVAIKQFPTALTHYTAKKIRLELPAERTVIIDDEPIKGSVFTIEVVPKSLVLLVGKKAV